ncbi:MAG: polyprenyl synthetase family protein [Anaerolineae bacterium]|nr:polyprenyl synthetase family protein [Anaerolineae bacterium]
MNPFTRYLPTLEAAMRQAVAQPSSQSPPRLYGMLGYHLGWLDAEFQPTSNDGGKRLRPVFLLLANEAHGGDWKQALPAAVAVELLHNFSLIHDDIEDRDRTRRGRPTLWALWGEAQAINTGDAMFAISMHAMTSLRDTGVPAWRTLEALTRFETTTQWLTEGQCLDLGFETQGAISEEAYLRMIAGKTAALLGLCCELGALIAGAEAAQVTAMWEFGHFLGMGFQMQDDILGLWGNPERTGKPVGADLRQRKKTLPILHGMARSEEFRTLAASSILTDQDVERAQDLLEAAGSRSHTEAQAEVYHHQALAALERAAGQGEAYQMLRLLAAQLLNRDK